MTLPTPNYRKSPTRIAQQAWEAFRDAKNASLKGTRSPRAKSLSPRLASNHRSSFMAGFKAGLIKAEQVLAQMKTHETLQMRNVYLQAENIELRQELRGLKKTLRYIHQTTSKHYDEEI